MDNKQFIIELLKFGAWPFVSVLAIYLLKDKIVNIFCGGIKSAKHGDTEIQFFEPTQPVNPASQEQQNLQHLIPVDPTGIREEFEEILNHQLEKISDENKKIEILVKNLAQQQISNTFEKVYFNIFGSQIKLLEFLSTQADGKAPVQTVTPFFEAAKLNNPDVHGNHQFSDYMAFLLSWGLVKSINGEWSITNHGRAFITYITAMQLNKNRAF